jgi:hypothetical protein
LVRLTITVKSSRNDASCIPSIDDPFPARNGAMPLRFRLPLASPRHCPFVSFFEKCLIDRRHAWLLK